MTRGAELWGSKLTDNWVTALLVTMSADAPPHPFWDRRKQDKAERGPRRRARLELDERSSQSSKVAAEARSLPGRGTAPSERFKL